MPSLGELLRPVDALADVAGGVSRGEARGAVDAIRKGRNPARGAVLSARVGGNGELPAVGDAEGDVRSILAVDACAGRRSALHDPRC